MAYRYGENHHRAKLSDGDVIKIRKMRANGVSIGEIAKCFSVGKTAIHKIIHFKSRADVVDDIFEEDFSINDHSLLPWYVQDRLKAAAAIKSQPERLSAINDVISATVKVYPHRFRECA